MTLITAVTTLATLLWCYALVLSVAWVRAVGATDRRDHVGHFVGLMGVFVPGIALTVATVIVGAVVGVPQIVVAIALLLPASVAIGLQLELARLVPPNTSLDAQRLALAVGLAALHIAVV
jgi:hypothetical protein